MKKHLSRWFLLFFVASQVNGLQAQDNTAATRLTSFAKHFATFAKDYPQEKVYLHFDNTTYFLGESIWFKAYVVTAERNALSQLSKTLYVELVTAEGDVVDTKKLKIENGQCHGDFVLPPARYAGFYEVRAFTRYMLNQEKEYLFSRVFPVYDKPDVEGVYEQVITERATSQQVPRIRKEHQQKENLSVTFFPEGGNLVAGISSRVAFKATGKNGDNAIVSGAVYDEKGQPVAEISTGYLDMGFFEFTPVQGKYTAKVQYNNKEYSFPLPQALPAGYVINVNNLEKDKVDIIIFKNETTPSDLLGLTVSSRGRVYAFEQLTIGQENALMLSLPKKMLPSGVSQVSLFNEKGDVLAERLVFVNHRSAMNIRVSQDKPVYKPYEKVSMQFNFADLKDAPVETTFSVAVHDKGTTSSSPYNDNLLTNLLLSSEVRGYIDNPGYYFESDDATRAQALDLLLLTQGWSRYSWKQMAGVEPFNVKEPIEKSLVIEGTVLSTLLKQKSPDVDISMVLINDSISQQGKCLTDKEGKFNFALEDFYGQGKLILQSKANEKKVEKNILLYRNFSPELKQYAFAELHRTDYVRIGDDVLEQDASRPEANTDNASTLKTDKNHLLKEVEIKSRRKNSQFGPLKVNMQYKVEREMDKRRDNGIWQPSDIMAFLELHCKYYSSSTGKYKGKNVLFIKDNSMQLISGVNALLMGTDNLSNASATPVGLNVAPQETASENEIFDNSEGTNDKQLSILPRIDEIESVSVIEDLSSIIRISPQLQHPSGTVIIVLHRKKNYRPEPQGVRETKYDGYAYTREFYSPQYNYVGLPKEKDYRRTLYWNPNVKTDATGRAIVSFYNNDSCKAMHVSAETVTGNGLIGVFDK